MGDPLSTIGHALGRSMRDIAVGFASGDRPQANPAPQAPDVQPEDWNTAHEQQRILAQREEEAKVAGSELGNKVTQLNVESLERQEKGFTDLGDAIKRWKAETDPAKKQDIRGEVELILSHISGRLPLEKLQNIGVRMTAAIAKEGYAKVPWNEIPPEVLERAGRDALGDVTTTVSTINQRDIYDNIVGTTRTTTKGEAGSPQAQKISDAETTPQKPSSLTGAKSKEDIVMQNFYAQRWAGARLLGKNESAMQRWAAARGLELPVSSPADIAKTKVPIKLLEDALPELEKTMGVLKNYASRARIQNAVRLINAQSSSASRQGELTALFDTWMKSGEASMLTPHPDEQAFLAAYNKAREAVQGLRVPLGGTRSTQALYNSLSSMLPNPYQTTTMYMANMQIAGLKQQIADVKVGYTMPGSQEVPKAPEVNAGSQKRDSHGYEIVGPGE